MIEAMELIFYIVKFQFDMPSNFNESRWISGDKTDEDWLANSKLRKSYSFSNSISFGLLEYDGNNYFIATGLKSPQKIPVGLSEIELNAGLFSTIIYEFELPIENTVSNYYLENNILSQHNNIESYNGHDFKELEKIFPHIFVAELTKDYFGDIENLEQIASFYLAHNERFLSLKYSEKTRNNFIELITTNSFILNYESILQSLLSSQFKFAFLDLYRCFELLFQIVYVDKLHSNLSLSSNKLNFLESIEKELVWKPNERNSTKKIISETDGSYVNEIEIAIKSFDNQIKDCGNWFYDLRCSIVHLKSVHKTFDLSPKNWDEMIGGLTKLLTFWYQKYPDFN